MKRVKLSDRLAFAKHPLSGSTAVLRGFFMELERGKFAMEIYPPA